MEIYLFNYEVILTWQLFFGLFAGSLTTYLLHRIITTEIMKHRRAKLIKSLRRITELENHKTELLGEVMWFKKRYTRLLDKNYEYEKERRISDETIIELSKEKDKLLTENKKLLAEKNHWYLEYKATTLGLSFLDKKLGLKKTTQANQ